MNVPYKPLFKRLFPNLEHQMVFYANLLPHVVGRELDPDFLATLVATVEDRKVGENFGKMIYYICGRENKKEREEVLFKLEEIAAKITIEGEYE